jgi:hypothetical protein
MAKLPCPTKYFDTDEWKALEEGVGGRDKAMLAYFRHGSIPDVPTARTILGGFKDVAGKQAGGVSKALNDWRNNRMYIDGNGNYHLKAEGSNRGPIHPDNKLIKSTFASVDDLHKAAHKGGESATVAVDPPKQAASTPKPTPASEGQEPGGRVTGVNKAFIESSREARGEGEVQGKKPYVTTTKATELARASKIDKVALTNDLIANDRPATATEVAALKDYRVDLLHEIDAATGDSAKSDDALRRLNNMETAIGRGLSEASQTMTAAKGGINVDDYSLSGAISRYARTHMGMGEANPEVLQQIKDLTDENARLKSESDLHEASKSAAKTNTGPPKTRFAKNKIFVEDKVNEYLQFLKENPTILRSETGAIGRIKGQKLLSDLDPKVLEAYKYIAGAHIEAGVRSFADFSAKMVGQLGEAVRPYIQQLHADAANDKRLDAFKARWTARGDKANATEEAMQTAGPPYPSKPAKMLPVELDRQAAEIRDRTRINEAKIDKLVDPPKPKTLLDHAVNLYRESILMWPTVLVKLAAADVWNALGENVADVPSWVAGHLPMGDGKTLSDLAGGTGEWSPKAQLKGARAFASRKAISEAVETLKTSTGEVGRIYGQSAHDLELGGIAGRGHGAIKAPMLWSAYTKAAELRFIKLDRIARKFGAEIDLQDRDIQEMVSTGAAKDAMTQIFQGKNRLSDGLNDIYRAMEKQGRAGRIAASGFKLLTIVRNVSSNIAGRTFQMTGAGVPEGFIRWAEARKQFAETGEHITTDEADKIVRAFGYGSFGVAAAILGTHPTKAFRVAPMYGTKPMKDNEGKDMAPGSMQVLGVHIPTLFAHYSFPGAASMWSTYHAEAPDKGHLRAIGLALKGFAVGLPGGRFAEDAAKNWNRPDIAAAHVASGFNPGAIQYGAEYFDKDKQGNPIKRNPQTPLEVLKMGIPGKYGRGSVPKSLFAAKAALDAKLKTFPRTQAGDEAAFAYGQEHGAKAGILNPDTYEDHVDRVRYPGQKSKPWKSKTYR